MIRAFDLWLPSWFSRDRSARPCPEHLILAVCDHFEPYHDADKATALRRVAHWRSEYPKMAAGQFDADGILPRHSFFYPIEQHDPDVLAGLAGICQATGSEVEVHLHHNDDTPENLRETLETGKERFREFGFLSRDQAGAIRYGFIHGNWALDNSHPKHRFCGVSNELSILRDTGCYADFTMPSAPDPCQTRTINSIYYAKAGPASKSHDRGTPLRAGHPGSGDLLMIQGPLGLNWHRRKWGFIPRVENGDLTGINPPTLDRLAVWMECGVHVLGAPNWLFVKLHTHGAVEKNSGMLLGEPMRQFHQELRSQGIAVHYVTAREMANIAHAAEDGHTGNPGAYRDYRYTRF